MLTCTWAPGLPGSFGSGSDNPDPKQWADNGLPPEKWRDGVFVAPHAACWDRAGNLYVLDWLRAGRVSKLERVAERERVSEREREREREGEGDRR